ncbi:hypothetical protein M758_1G251100 [Ceratodon purpureus]|nr:hypothetical protein M758_1G251100 [Ceratodon purpureus]
MNPMPTSTPVQHLQAPGSRFQVPGSRLQRIDNRSSLDAGDGEIVPAGSGSMVVDRSGPCRSLQYWS